MRFIYILALVFISSYSLKAQTDTSRVIQFSGQIFHEERGQMQPLIYANIYVEGTNRGTVSDFDGFFSLPVRPNELINFRYLGFADVQISIPDTLTEDRYFSMILMAEDTIDFEPVVILPWPSKEHFDIEFAAMDVTDELADRARENLAQSVMAELREELPYDGRENFNEYLKEKQAEYYSAGQTRPMNILNPLAWKKFIDQWKSGKYKKKKKK